MNCQDLRAQYVVNFNIKVRKHLAKSHPNASRDKISAKCTKDNVPEYETKHENSSSYDKLVLM